MIHALAISACVLASIPTALFLWNLFLYRALAPSDGARRQCSVLIPARNEEANIADALRSVLESEGVDLEVIVLDDGSSDRTAEIVRSFAERDSRVRLENAPPLPAGWCGKNHACQHLSTLASYPLLLFMDADTRITRPDSLARLAGFMARGNAALASGVPREETGTFLEKMIVPLIHFVLLGFLPIAGMRRFTAPSFAAACGQIVAARRDAYDISGGHATISDRLHDGPAIARSFRACGFRTDLFDATDTFHCRMYRNAREVLHGFAKNAHEALASRHLILPSTALLLGGQVLPLFLVIFAPSALALAAFAIAMLPRLLAACRFKQSLLGALLHPLGICLLVAIQWHAFTRSLRRRPAVWKGRAYPAIRAT